VSISVIQRDRVLGESHDGQLLVIYRHYHGPWMVGALLCHFFEEWLGSIEGPRYMDDLRYFLRIFHQQRWI
jgi:hypothetical protein